MNLVCICFYFQPKDNHIYFEESDICMFIIFYSVNDYLFVVLFFFGYCSCYGLVWFGLGAWVESRMEHSVHCSITL